MASNRIKLDPETIEAVARRVIALLECDTGKRGGLVDAVGLARRLGLSALGSTPTRSNSER